MAFVPTLPLRAHALRASAFIAVGPRVCVARPRRAAARQGIAADVRMQVAVSHEVFMPALSSTMSEGKIVQWLKQPGDRVVQGEAIMVVESDKADMDVEAFENGYLAAILVEEGESCAVGNTVGLIAENEADIEKVKAGALASSASSMPAPVHAAAAVAATVPMPAPVAPVSSAAPAAPAVRRPDFGEVFMPALSSTMTEGKVVDWLKEEGDPIEKGDIVMIVESDKADMDVEAFDSGFLAHISVEAGEMSPIGEAVGYLAKTEADIPAVKTWALSQSADPMPVVASTPAKAAPAAQTNSTPAATSSLPPVVNTGRIVASPFAKVTAKRLGVDLRTVSGSGPNGRIVEADVAKAAASAPAAVVASSPSPPGKIVATPDAKKVSKKEKVDLTTITGTGNFGRITLDDVLRAAGKAPVNKAAVTKPAATSPSTSASVAPSSKASPPTEMPAGAVAMNAMQKAVVKNMTASVDVPVYRVSYKIKTTAFDELYAKVKSKGVTVSSLLAKAVAVTLTKHPIVNASYAENATVFRPDINVAMAVSLPDGGLITPVLKNADQTDLYSLSRKWKDLIRRSMEKKLSPDEYNSGTFFVSNLGMFGVDSFDSILPPGAGAILAVSASKPVVSLQPNGLVGVSKEMKVTLTADHRHIYGAHVAEFLRDLADLIENNMTSVLL